MARAPMSAPTLCRMSVDPQQRRMSFNRDATTYHEGRPPYPARVYDLLADRYSLTPGSRVLEIGAGSVVTA